MIEFGFSALKLNRTMARHMTKNPASGPVIQKAGMTHEGILRQAMFRFGHFEDLAVYSVLHNDWGPSPAP